MCQAQGLKVLLADEKKGRLIDGSHRCRVITSIEYRKFGDGTAWAFDAEHVLSSTGRTLKNSYMA